MTEPEEVLAVAVVGYGYWGMNQARNVDSAASTTLTYVVDPDSGRQAQARQRYPAARVTDRLHDALESSDVAAVVVATPSSTHHKVAAAAIDAGKHVLVEKPLAMTSAEARDLVERAARRGVQLSAGHTFIYSSPVRALKAHLDAGEFGRVRYLAFQRRSLGKVRSDCNVLWNLGPHDVSIALYLLGECPAQVRATGLTFLQDGIEDVVFATLSMPSGVGVGMHLSWLDPRKTRELTLVGSEKMAVYDDVSLERTIEIFDSGVQTPEEGMGEFASMAEWQWKTRAGDVVIPRLERWEPLHRQIDEFAAACMSGTPTVTHGAHGVEVVRVLEALDISLRRGGDPIDLAGELSPS